MPKIFHTMIRVPVITGLSLQIWGSAVMRSIKYPPPKELSLHIIPYHPATRKNVGRKDRRKSREKNGEGYEI